MGSLLRSPASRAIIAAAGTLVLMAALWASRPAEATPPADDISISAGAVWTIASVHITEFKCSEQTRDEDVGPTGGSSVGSSCSNSFGANLFTEGGSGSANQDIEFTYPAQLMEGQRSNIVLKTNGSATWSANLTSAKGFGEHSAKATGQGCPTGDYRSSPSPGTKSGGASFSLGPYTCAITPTSSSPNLITYEAYATTGAKWPEGSVLISPAYVDVLIRITYQKIDTPVDLTIGRIEVVQAVQDEFQSVPLIEGKYTMVRVFPSADRFVPNVTAQLLGPAGEILTPINGPVVASKIFQRDQENGSLNFRLPPTMSIGSYPIIAEVNPAKTVVETNTTNNKSAPKQITFEPMGGLNIQYLRYCPSQPGGTQPCPSESRGDDVAWVRGMYPVDPAKVTYTPYQSNPVLSTRSFLTVADAITILNKLEEKYQRWTAPNRPDQIVVVLQYPVIALAKLAGIAGGGFFGSHVAIIGETSGSKNLAYKALAHEIGHNLDLDHVPKADPGCSLPESFGAWPYQDAKIHGNGWWMTEARQIWRSDQSYDVMAYCPDVFSWISPDHYKKLKARNLRPLAEGGDELAIQAPTQQVVLNGTVRRDGTAGSLEPAFQVLSNDPPQVSNPSGTHCLRFTNATTTLATHCFTPSFKAGEGEIDLLDISGFVVRVAMPAGATRVALIVGGKELAFRAAGTTPPSIGLMTPKVGDSWSGTQTITWNGSGVSYAVEASSDGGNTWFPIGLDLGEKSMTLNSRDLGLGANVYVRVIATDGLRNSTSTVGPITVRNQVVVPVACDGCQNVGAR